MTQSQAKLSAYIDSLLSTLAGKSVNIRIVKTTDNPDADYTTVITEAQRGKVVSSIAC